ncbi:MAG TPA: alpha/beta hydrolase-fold protein [Chitinophagales bacterium]|nr:alpha/beta hydrolase-fold protein [Chitinophagales bacterium]HMZ88199.1 alpha/beta hydrolase-fold protein [Chitinophagales bacterium]HNA57187.1 alpha/beta hydrolase-fold protein [Chitinophagales bacterium]HNE44602.1 alpha/beta hydrolase-fold protein [Chitinophagales bacterium]HNF68408.1 alpha/beta hydrolase-fold protein [Chitinophagales bacterium]
MNKLQFLSILLLATFSGFAQSPSARPFTIGVTEILHSNILNEDRIINIYLPEGYSKDDSINYPVIYLLDGGADEDFIHIAGLVQFNNFPWIARVPNSIVVGIANTDRKRDLTYPTTITEDKQHYPTTGGSAAFMSFIEKELQPFIETNYSITHDYTLIGQSLGGLFATEVLFTKPQLFNRYIIISPSLWWDDASLLKQHPVILDSTFTQQLDIYIGVGKEGLAPCTIPHVMEVDANLLSEMITYGSAPHVSVHFDYLPEEDHATVTHQAVFNAFRILYPEPKEE